MRKLWHIGIDEAGRGPLAGPVSVGAVLIRDEFDWELIPGVDDSKKLTEAKREAIYAIAHELQRAALIDFQVSLIAPSVIDRIGIVPSVRRGIKRCLDSLEARHEFSCDEVRCVLDGSLRAPAKFKDQETIIGGDGIERSIGLASILAKVTRDRHMVRLAHRYPEYGFDIHKGYATKAHRSQIMLCGLSDMHRKSFCKMLQR